MSVYGATFNDASGIKKDLVKLVDYLWNIEHKDWEELDNPEDHIFHAINNIKLWLIGQNTKEREQKNLMDKRVTKVEKIVNDFDQTLNTIIKQYTNKE